MPIFPDFADIDLEMINLLIKKELKEQNSAQKRPFLQLPTPHPAQDPEIYDKIEEKQKDSEVIVIDL